MKKLIAIALTVGMIFALAACAGKSSTSAKATKVPKIGMAMIDQTNPGFVGIYNGAVAAGKDYKDDLIWKSCGGNLDKQIADIRGFIQEKVDVIMIDSVDVKGITPVVNEATAAGVQVLAIGSKVSGKDNYSAVYPDLVDSIFAARLIGNIYKGQKGTIGLIVGSPGNLVSDVRQQGFNEGMKDFPNLKVVTGIGNWDPQTAMTATENMINANPDLLHVHCIQDGMSYSVLSAIKNSGKKITMSSHDGDPQGLINLENGDYIAENLTGAARIGYWFTALCDSIARGYDMDKIQYLKTYEILTPAMKDMAVKAGINIVNGQTLPIITAGEATDIANNYRNEFGPGKFKPTKS